MPKLDELLEPEAPSRDELADALESGGDSGTEEKAEQQQAAPDTGRLEAEYEKRLRDTQRWGQTEHQRAQQLEAQLHQFAMERQQMLDAYQRAQASAEPDVDWEEALTDPEKLKRSMRTVAQALESRVHAAYGPVFNENVALRNEIARIRSSQTDVNMERAKEVWVDKGFDPSAFDALRNDIQNMVDQGAVSSPAQMVQAGMLLADTRDMSFVSKSSPSVPSVPSRPGSVSTVPADIQRMYDHVQSRMGLDRQSLSQADLEEMGLGEADA